MVTITRVAVLFDGLVFSLPKPYRHHHVLRIMKHHSAAKRWQNSSTLQGREVQGFVSSDGKFLDRYEALNVFKDSFQKWYDLNEYPSGLYSENCWPTPGKWNGEPGSPERQLWEWNENPEVIESKLEISPFTGSIKPYRKKILIVD